WQIHRDLPAQEIRRMRLLPQRSTAARADLPRLIAEASGRGRPAFREEDRAQSRQLVQAVWSWSKDRPLPDCVEGFLRTVPPAPRAKPRTQRPKNNKGDTPVPFISNRSRINVVR